MSFMVVRIPSIHLKEWVHGERADLWVVQHASKISGFERAKKGHPALVERFEHVE